jgi:hypothetical protein
MTDFNEIFGKSLAQLNFALYFDICDILKEFLKCALRAAGIFEKCDF